MSDRYYNKGLIHFNKGDLTAAKEQFQKAVLFNPTISDYDNIHGLCLYQLGDFNKAKQLWRKRIFLSNDQSNLAFRYLETLEEKDCCFKILIAHGYRCKEINQYNRLVKEIFSDLTKLRRKYEEIPLEIKRGFMSSVDKSRLNEIDLEIMNEMISFFNNVLYIRTLFGNAVCIIMSINNT